MDVPWVGPDETTTSRPRMTTRVQPTRHRVVFIDDLSDDTVNDTAGPSTADSGNDRLRLSGSRSTSCATNSQPIMVYPAPRDAAVIQPGDDADDEDEDEELSLAIVRSRVRENAVIVSTGHAVRVAPGFQQAPDGGEQPGPQIPVSQQIPASHLGQQILATQQIPANQSGQQIPATQQIPASPSLSSPTVFLSVHNARLRDRSLPPPASFRKLVQIFMVHSKYIKR